MLVVGQVTVSSGQECSSRPVLSGPSCPCGATSWTSPEDEVDSGVRDFTEPREGTADVSPPFTYLEKRWP